jgi:hypothetical protein
MLFAACAACAACGDNDSDPSPPPPDPPAANVKPDFLKGEIQRESYDGSSDDLLTAGLGKTGLAGAAPAIADAANPTAAELRRQAIYNNYRALVDMTANGGYGTLYGPNVDATGAVGTGEGKIAGEEYLAYADDGTGKLNVTLMVQIPSAFDPQRPCIVSATSSGSRGVYGAISTAGEWGLKHGCAVAYTDKGTGNGGHDLATNTVAGKNGVRGGASALGTSSMFTAAGSDAERATYNTSFPNRWAYKHAHSQQNPEQDWGLNTIQAVRFAFYQLNEKYGPLDDDGVRRVTITRESTTVIASSVSNGGGAAIAAVEQDTENWIDGLAVAEPQVQLDAPAGVTIRRGATAVAAHSKKLFDYFTIANLYQPCAAHAAAAGSVGLAFVSLPIATNRCAALAAQGLITGATLEERSVDALAKLHAAGWEADSDPFQATHYALATLAVTYSYAAAYSRAGVRLQLRRGAGRGRAGAAGRRRGGSAVRHRQRRAADQRHQSPQQQLHWRHRPRRRIDHPGDRAGRLQRHRRGLPARVAHRQHGARGGAARRHRAGEAHRRSARQAGDHRPRPLRHADPGEPHLAPVLRAQPARRCQQQARLLRGDQRAALRCLPRQRRARRLRHAAGAAAPLLHPGDGSGLRQPDEQRAAAALAGGAHHAARRYPGRRSGDHRRQRAGDHRHAGGGQRDHLRRQRADDSGLEPRGPDGLAGGGGAVALEHRVFGLALSHYCVINRARIPDRFRSVARLCPRWDRALQLLQRAVANGVPPGLVLADQAYGSSKDFRKAIREMGLPDEEAVGAPSDAALAYRRWKTSRSRSRPERHFADSFATMRLAIARALARWLPRCPTCPRVPSTRHIPTNKCDAVVLPKADWQPPRIHR